MKTGFLLGYTVLVLVVVVVVFVVVVVVVVVVAVAVVVMVVVVDVASTTSGVYILTWMFAKLSSLTLSSASTSASSHSSLVTE